MSHSGCPKGRANTSGSSLHPWSVSLSREIPSQRRLANSHADRKRLCPSPNTSPDSLDLRQTPTCHPDASRMDDHGQACPFYTPIATCQPHTSPTSSEADASQESASVPASTPNPSYASVLKAQAEDIINPMPHAQHFLQDDEQTAIAIQGTKEDEVLGYSNDERAFLNQVVPNIRVRPDRMIELPLPIKEAKPTFPSNRTIAFKRTKSALESLRKNPEFFQKHLTSLPLTWTGTP